MNMWTAGEESDSQARCPRTAASPGARLAGHSAREARPVYVQAATATAAESDAKKFGRLAATSGVSSASTAQG